MLISIQAYDKKCINIKLKCRKRKSYQEKSTSYWYTVTYLWLKPLKQRLIDVT